MRGSVAGERIARALATGNNDESAESGSLAMAKKKSGKGKRKVESVFLVCQETGDYNYALRRKSGGEKLKLMKYSPRLRKHTVHTEKRK